MAYVARGVRQARDVTKRDACEAAMVIMRNAWAHDGESSPDSIEAVEKALQKLENGRETIPQFDIPNLQPLIDEAVQGAIDLLDRRA